MRTSYESYLDEAASRELYESYYLKMTHRAASVSLLGTPRARP
jgi:hypothetical protein